MLVLQALKGEFLHSVKKAGNLSKPYFEMEEQERPGTPDIAGFAGPKRGFFGRSKKGRLLRFVKVAGSIRGRGIVTFGLPPEVLSAKRTELFSSRRRVRTMCVPLVGLRWS